MAAVNINDVASQLNTASRLVVSTDFFWIYMANGSQVKIPAEFARAYLIAGIKPVINKKRPLGDRRRRSRCSSRGKDPSVSWRHDGYRGEL